MTKRTRTSINPDYPLPNHIGWSEFVAEDWLRAAQYRCDLYCSGELPRHPAAILEEQERLMELAWQNRQPKKYYHIVTPPKGKAGLVTYVEQNEPQKWVLTLKKTSKKGNKSK